MWEHRMDLNYLYHRHQVSLFMAANAASEAVRRVHHELADAYASRIASMRNAPRAGAA
jgi:hypothetical protein